VDEAYGEPDIYCTMRYYAGQPEFLCVAFYTRAAEKGGEGGRPTARSDDNTDGTGVGSQNEQRGKGGYSSAGWDSNFETSWDSYLKETRTLFGARLHRRAEDDRQFAVNERLAKKLAIREVEARLARLDGSGLIAELEVLDLDARRARAVDEGATEEGNYLPTCRFTVIVHL
jgi:hypothetical protein